MPTPSTPSAPELASLLAEVRRIAVLARRLATGVMAGGYGTVFRGAGIEVGEVREYVPGDDPRSVDWSVTARTGRPHVKKYVDERERTVLFVFDLSASMDGGFGAWSARQTAARVCACLALSAAGHEDKTGLVAFSEGVDRFVPPKKGPGHVLRIVRDCLALAPRGPRTDMAPALELVARSVRRRSVVFVASDFLSGGWERALAQCARRHDTVAVRLLVPELDALPAAMVRVRDPETGRADVIDGADRAVRREYARRVAAWRSSTEAALARLRVDRMDVPVPRTAARDAIAGPILRFFRMRELRGAKA